MNQYWTFTVENSYGNTPSFVLRKNDDESVSSFPMVEDNSDYQQYLAWLAEGHTPEPWEAPNAD